jgi:N-methylhydantoinase B
VDGDGVDLERAPVVRVAVHVGGGEVQLDFSETDDQAAGAINASFSQALTGAVFAVRCFVDPSIPTNEGSYRPIRIRFRRGSLLDPHPPAACGGRVVSVLAVCEAVVAALSQARPELATAASSVIHPYTLAGVGANPWVLLAFEYGGLGARRGSDGPSATGSFFLGGRNAVPQIEPLEARFPIRVEAQRLVPDSGGAGRWRGGLGVETRIRLLEPALLAVRAERVRFAPRGIEGGSDGMAGTQVLVRADGAREPLPAKLINARLAPGDLFALVTSGGGGLGDPRERDGDALALDVEEGLVTPEAAARHYARRGA